MEAYPDRWFWCLRSAQIERSRALLPLACGAIRSLAQELPLVRFRDAEGEPGLPEQVASLVRAQPDGTAHVRLYNDADLARTVGVAIGECPWREVEVPPGETAEVTA